MTTFGIGLTSKMFSGVDDLQEINLNNDSDHFDQSSSRSKVIYERQESKMSTQSVPPLLQQTVAGGQQPRQITNNTNFKSLKPIENFDLKLLPRILKHLDTATILEFMKVNWNCHRLCAPLVYEKVCFSQLSGKKLEIFMRTLQASFSSRDGRNQTSVDYSSFVRHLNVNNIVFEEDTSLQSWTAVRDVIALVADNLVSLSLNIGDESFVDLSPDYVYLHSETALSALKNLSLQSKCSRVPPKLVSELLRAAPIGGLKSIRMYRCLTNFDATGWFLISERGGESLQDLVLTPSVGPNMLGWDEKLFKQGLQNISKTCPNLKRIDFSGHAIPLPDQALQIFCESRRIEEIYAPCTMNDAHLLIFMGKPAWPNAKCIGLSCLCVTGEITEKQRNGMSCNRFTDHVLLEFLDYMMNSASSKISVYLPVYLIALKTGKRIETLQWLSMSMHITKREKDFFWFKDKLVLSIFSNRLATFF